MSTRTFQWVWEHSEARGVDRLVLLAIADEAEDDGFNARPSQRRIAQKAREPQTNVRRSIDRLEGAGELLVKRPDKPAPGRHSRYFLTMGRDPHELATAIEWPTPRLDDLVRAEWEQLTLATESMRKQHAAEGYEMRFREPREVEYPPTVGDEPVDTAPTAPDCAEPRHPGDPVPRQTESAIGGTDPLSLSTPLPNQQQKYPQPVRAGVPDEAETKRMLDEGRQSDADAEYPPLEKVREMLGRPPKP